MLIYITRNQCQIKLGNGESFVAKTVCRVWKKLSVTILGEAYQRRAVTLECYPDSSSSNVFASWRSAVSKPSVNQP